MQKNPIISVVIPCYNTGLFLSSAIDSVLSQSYQSFEIIIIDDGSTDNTKKVVDKYCSKDERLRYHYQTNKGRSAARNKGIELSEGEFIQFLDADDLIQEKKFEVLLREFQINNHPDVIYSNFEFFSEKEHHFKILPKNPERRLLIKENILEDFIFGWNKEGLIIPIHCPLFKASFLKKNNIRFNTSVEAKEDWIFWVQIALNNAHIHFTDKILAYYRKHDESTVHNHSLMFKDGLKASFIVYDMLPSIYRKRFIDEYSNDLTNTLQYFIDRYNQLKSSPTQKLGRFILTPWRIIKKITR